MKKCFKKNHQFLKKLYSLKCDNLNNKLTNEKNIIIEKYNLNVQKNNKDLEEILKKESNNKLKKLQDLQTKYEAEKKIIEENYNSIIKELKEKYIM